jgi:hypothetical protein
MPCFGKFRLFTLLLSALSSQFGLLHGQANFHCACPEFIELIAPKTLFGRVEGKNFGGDADVPAGTNQNLSTSSFVLIPHNP